MADVLIMFLEFFFRAASVTAPRTSTRKTVLEFVLMRKANRVTIRAIREAFPNAIYAGAL